MYSFLVLGYVPGTSLQINFQGWLDIASLLAVAFMIRQYLKHRQLVNEWVQVRQPLHASQLHRRLTPTAR